MTTLEAGEDLAVVERDLETSLWRDSLRDYALTSPAYASIAGKPLRLNYAVDAMLDVYQAIADGELTRVRIEIGPGLSKSTIKTVCTSWRFARDAAYRCIHGSHAFDLAGRDSRRARRIVESDWYRQRFPKVRLRDDENTMAAWSTTAGGSYVAVGVCGSLTGHRTSEVWIDDGLNAIDAHNKAARETAYTWLTEGLLTRLDGDGVVVVIGQRLSTDDLHGRLAEAGYTVVTLPAEYDSRRRCIVTAPSGREVWRDPRQEDAELLAPEVLSAEKLADLRASIGSQALETQYNENPSSDETSMCPARWWRFYRSAQAPTGSRRPFGCDDGPAAVLPERMQRVCVVADLSFGSVKGDYAVVQAWGAVGGARYLLRHWRARAGFDAQLAAIDGFVSEFPGCTIAIEKAANGAAVGEQLRKKHPAVLMLTPVGGKAQRLAAVVPQIEGGSVYLPEHASYTADIVDEFRTFGTAAHDDIVDCGVWGLFSLSHRVVDEAEPAAPMLVVRESSDGVTREHTSMFGTSRRAIGGYIPEG